MLYHIGYIPSKGFQDFYAGLIEDISGRFQLSRLAKKKRIPHITLKAPFEISHPESLDILVKSFSQSQKLSEITIDDVGNFGEEVIFLRSQPSKQMTDTFRQLLYRLSKVKQISWSEYDNPDKTFHITLAKGEELDGRFQEVYDYFKTQGIKFVLPFDNLTIFQKDGGRTSIYRTYCLGKQE